MTPLPNHDPRTDPTRRLPLGFCRSQPAGPRQLRPKSPPRTAGPERRARGQGVACRRQVLGCGFELRAVSNQVGFHHEGCEARCGEGVSECGCLVQADDGAGDCAKDDEGSG